MIDITQLVSSIAMPFTLVIVFAFVVAFFKSNWFKGKLGESIVDVSSKLKLGASYKIYKDLTLRLNDGTTTQLDHVVLSPYGIFVIETKNMQGWIYGSAAKRTWTQNIYGKKSSFQNPLHQNYRHVKALHELLNIDENHIHSLVIFIGDSTFKTSMPENVFNGTGYISYIKSFRDTVLNSEHLSHLQSRLENNTLRGKQAHKSHINDLKKRHSISTKKPYELDPKITCRRCGNVMVERTNKKTSAAFLGCSSYPNCKNTEPL